jgi:hypothetical protein
VGNSGIKGREVKCFIAIAGGEERSASYLDIHFDKERKLTTKKMISIFPL